MSVSLSKFTFNKYVIAHPLCRKNKYCLSEYSHCNMLSTNNPGHIFCIIRYAHKRHVTKSLLRITYGITKLVSRLKITNDVTRRQSHTSVATLLTVVWFTRCIFHNQIRVSWHHRHSNRSMLHLNLKLVISGSVTACDTSRTGSFAVRMITRTGARSPTGDGEFINTILAHRRSVRQFAVWGVA